MKRGFGFRAGTLFFPVGIVDKNLYLCHMKLRKRSNLLEMSVG